MKASDHDRAGDIFLDARELARDERSAFLDRTCQEDQVLRAEVESLLSADEHASKLEDIRGLDLRVGLQDLAREFQTPMADAAEDLPKLIGQYRIISRIGQGGMGIVYEAQQEYPSRRVALKVLRPGMGTGNFAGRLQREAQILAKLQHPGIAQIYDAGFACIDSSTPANQPYLAMELVNGGPIDEYVASRGLNVAARLQLVARICDALHYAHTRSIIHRDLKPSNVLVDQQGRPKILDFGVARVTDADVKNVTLQTEAGQLVGTLAYMSPEQVAGRSDDLDTRCDVYAVGVMLYELLAGKRPHSMAGRSITEAIQVIRDDDPIRIGTLDRALRGDIESIVCKAMEKDRDRRYQSTAALAADLSRYLAHEPIEARPASKLYQLRKFAKRHRGLVAGLAMTFAALLIGLAGTSYYLLESIEAGNDAVREKDAAIAARNDADNARLEADRVATFQSTQLAGINVPQMGQRLRKALINSVDQQDRQDLEADLGNINFTDMALGILRRNIFDQTLAAIDTQFADQPFVQCRLLLTAASTMRMLGLMNEAVEPQRRAMEIQREVHGNQHRETLEAISQMGGLLTELGRLDEAEPLVREAFDTGRRVYGADDPDSQIWINSLFNLLYKQGKLEDAASLLRQSLAIQRNLLDPDDPKLLRIMGNLGGVLTTQGAIDEAEFYARQALAGRRRVLGHNHADTLAAIANLGSILRIQGNLTEAESLFRTAYEGQLQVLGTDHPKTLAGLNNLASILFRQGRFDEAEALYLKALELHRRNLGESHPETIRVMENLGALFDATGKYDQSIQYYVDTLTLRRRVFGDLHLDTLHAIDVVAGLLENAGQYGNAAALYAEAANGWGTVSGEYDVRTLTAISDLIESLNHQNLWAASEPHCRTLLERLRRIEGNSGQQVASTLQRLGHNLLKQAKYADAESTLAESLNMQRECGSSDWNVWNTQCLLGVAIAAHADRMDEAEQLLTEAAEQLLKSAHNGELDRLRATSASSRLVEFYTAHGRTDDAAKWQSKLDRLIAP